uniref:hypothetical protein n=1 Tax=Salmonella sp. TaxID=599 RepID=UPI001CD98364|nr:hypothetical protein [Salmonella sp.]
MDAIDKLFRGTPIGGKASLPSLYRQFRAKTHEYKRIIGPRQQISIICEGLK